MHSDRNNPNRNNRNNRVQRRNNRNNSNQNKNRTSASNQAAPSTNQVQQQHKDPVRVSNRAPLHKVQAPAPVPKRRQPPATTRQVLNLNEGIRPQRTPAPRRPRKPRGGPAAGRASRRARGAGAGRRRIKRRRRRKLRNPRRLKRRKKISKTKPTTSSPEGSDPDVKYNDGAPASSKGTCFTVVKGPGNF